MPDSKNSTRPDCGSIDHRLHRRLFLEGLTGTAAISAGSFGGLFGVDAFAAQAAAEETKCILLWLCGAPSQFETWDPKPRRPSGGPFQSTRSVIPGVHVSELMPQTASILDRFSLIRSMKTEPSEHFQAIDMLTRGEGPRPPFTRPILGSVVAKQLGHLDRDIPQFVFLDPCPEGNEFKTFKTRDWPGWLGTEHGPVRAGGTYGIADQDLPEGLSDLEHAERDALRQFLSKRYASRRQSAAVDSYNTAFKRVRGLMRCAPLFDLERLPERDRERYGPGTFGLHCLLARHLIEHGTTFAMVANGMPWDCHVMNHEIHQMLVPELDRILYHLITDLEDRGLLEKTLVIVMGEFGRTPWLNPARGRDHYPNAWSLALAGCGIQRGAVYGATDRDGVDVAENPVDQRRLFATIFSALGIDPHVEYELPGLPTFARVEEHAEPIQEVLQ